MQKFNFNLTLAFLAVIPTISQPIITSVPTPKNLEVQNFRKTIQQKIQAKLDESKNSPGQKMAWPGTIKQINSLELILDVSNQYKQIGIDNTIAYSNSKKIDTATLKPGQNILVMGIVKPESPDKMEAKQIILNPTPSPISQQRFSGAIGDISKSSKTIMVLPANQKESQVLVNDKTELLSPNKMSITYKDLFKGQQLIIFGQNKDKVGKTILATKIYALGQKPTATPSIAKPTQSK